MSLRDRAQFQNGEAKRAPADESDVEEEALVSDYRQQVQFDGMDDLDQIPSNLNVSHDIHAQLQAAATPLEFQATLETKFASYDNYCNLFHYILNSEGPVDLEVPNVRHIRDNGSATLTFWGSTSGHGTSSTSSSTSSTASAATAKRSP